MIWTLQNKLTILIAGVGDRGNPRPTSGANIERHAKKINLQTAHLKQLIVGELRASIAGQGSIIPANQ